MRDMVRYRTKQHLPLAPTKEDSWSYGDAVGGMGCDEETSAYPRGTEGNVVLWCPCKEHIIEQPTWVR